MAKASKESVVPYPTSAKKGPAKWDKIEAEVKEEVNIVPLLIEYINGFSIGFRACGVYSLAFFCVEVE